jgi:Leucine-rich repeat (LRR) protein
MIRPVAWESAMNPLSTCPSPATLQEYLLGGLSDAVAASLEEHVASCPGCRALLPTLRAEDDLVAAFRAQAGRTQPKNALLDRLAGDLHVLLRTVPTSVEATPATAGCAEETDDDVRSMLAPPRTPDEMGRLGDYRVLEVLGSGGMGVVFRAEDIRLRRHVALKAMRPALAANPKARQRFLREAQLTASLSHDHVVPIHHVGEEKGVPFLAMPLLQGESLDCRLKRGGRLPLAEVLRIGRETADGLAAAHAHGLIHRDIKPANLWLETLADEPGGLSPRYRVKILDFGLARSGEGDVHLTQSGAIVGTPAYMAPEQADGRVDHRADLFSLGCVLYRMATGEVPFAGDKPLEVLRKVTRDQPRPPRKINPELPAALADLIMQLLEKDPARRPASAGEVVESLQSLEKDLAAKKEFAQHAGALAAGPRKRRLALVAAALVLLAGLLGLGAAALIRISTGQGDYVIETDDPDFSFQVHAGAVKLEDRKTNKTYTLKVVKQEKDARDVEMEVSDGGDLVFKTKTFTIKRGEKAAVTAWFERKACGVDDAWIKLVAALPAEAQWAAVAAKLKELNPRFDGTVHPTIEGGVVTRLWFVTDEVTDISPVRALRGLQVLGCGGSGDGTAPFNNVTVLTCGFHLRGHGKGRLADLSPLKGLNLSGLSCSHTDVSDLTPLAGMPLTQLACADTRASDLSPLKGKLLTVLYCGETPVSEVKTLRGMPLEHLHLNDTAVSDLSPLLGMPLKGLVLHNTKVSDLSPLKGMKLRSLSVWHTPVSDLAPLAGMPLEHLGCLGTRVKDLSPLKGITLAGLEIRWTPVSDLSPLKGMPLKWLNCDFKPERDAAILRSIPTLETINDKPAKEVLGQAGATAGVADAWVKRVAALPAEEQVKAVVDKLKELNPDFVGQVTHKVENAQVTELVIETDQVTDLSPLRALPALHHLGCSGSGPGKSRLLDGQFQVLQWEPVAKGQGVHRLADLSPLKGSKLTHLDCSYSRVADLSPLKGMPLEALVCASTKVSDLTPLKDSRLVVLNCRDTPIADLSPLKDMPLGHLFVDFTRISDLSPLGGMQLQSLTCCDTAVADLSPLKGMKLTSLSCWRTKVTDLRPLAGMPLTALDCGGTKVADLSPLKGMHLKSLICHNTQVSDLSPLKGMPLAYLRCDFKPERDAAILRSIPTLETINDKPAKEFWKEVGQKQSTRDP